MQFRVLGPVEVEASDVSLRLGSGRERLVLALLLLRADRLTSAERLIDALWDNPPPTARQQLHNLIARLRRRLGSVDPAVIITRPFGYELRLGAHTLDLTEFRRLVADAKLHAARGDLDGATTRLQAALGLWRGPALADVPDTVTENPRQSLHDEQMTALDLLLDLLLRTGRAGDALTQASEHLGREPFNERLHAHRMRALAATGRRSEAVESYLQLRRRFIDELGVPPSQNLADLTSQILDGHTGPPAPALRPTPRELPATTWALVGRDALLADVVDDLRSGGAAGNDSPPGAMPSGGPTTVALVGVGGVGKTALAVAAGHAVAGEFPDGTLYAALDDSATAEPRAVLARFLRSLGVSDDLVPARTDELTAFYRSALAGRSVLVLLDGASSEAQVRALLPTASGSAAIVTSRRKLSGLVGARRHTVPPLTRTDSAALLSALVGPARSAREPEALAAIGDLCGHLPLALCVAGAKLAANNHLGLTDLRQRLEDEHTRLDELSIGDIDVRASIATSMQTLREPARQLFARLSLGPVTDWPEWVARRLAGGDGWRHALDDLVDQHLVEPTGRDDAGQPRFSVHSLVGELAAERLDHDESPDGRATLQRDLIEQWLRLAAIADDRLDPRAARPEAEPSAALDAPRKRHDEPTAMAARAAASAPHTWFETERANLVAAVATATEVDVLLAGRLVLRLRTFLTIRAYDDDRERLLRLVLDRLPGSAEPPRATEQEAELEVELLNAFFSVLAQRRTLDELPAVAARQLASARRLPDRRWEQGALNQSGWAAQSLLRFDEAIRWFEQAAELADRRDDALAFATARAQIGVVLRNAGRAEEADPLLAQMVEHVRVTGSARSTCIWLVTHAECLIDLGRLDDADVLVDEALDIADDLHDDLGAAHCRLARAATNVRRGRSADAQADLDAARPLLDHRAPTGVDPDCLRLTADIAVSRAEWPTARDALEASLGLYRSRGARLEVARDLARCSRVHEELGVSGHAGAEECAAILDELALDAGALRLPNALYGSAGRYGRLGRRSTGAATSRWRG